MQTQIETEDVILQKTRELCESIVQQPEFQSIRQRMDTFMADEKAQRQYEELSELGQQLHNKQHEGKSLTAAEIASFDKQRDAFLRNPVAKGFVDAQEELQNMKKTLTQYISKTLELGHVPAEDEMGEGGGCGSGCGCHH